MTANCHYRHYWMAQQLYNTQSTTKELMVLMYDVTMGNKNRPRTTIIIIGSRHTFTMSLFAARAEQQQHSSFTMEYTMLSQWNKTPKKDEIRHTHISTATSFAGILFRLQWWDEYAGRRRHCPSAASHAALECMIHISIMQCVQLATQTT